MFVEETSLYRRFTRIWYILAAATAFGLAYNLMSKSSSNSNSLFKYCTYANVLFVLSWALSLGFNCWVSFIAGPVMIKNMHRHQFAEIQRHLFPVYFLIQGITSFAQLATFLYIKGNLSSHTQAESLLFASLLAGLLNGFLNSIWFGPQTNKFGFKKIAMEKEEGVAPPNVGPKLKENANYRAVSKQFGMYHGMSTLLNLFALAGNFYVLYFLSRELVV